MPNMLEPRDIEKIKKGGREVQEGGVTNSLSCAAETLQPYKAILLQLKKKKRKDNATDFMELIA